MNHRFLLPPLLLAFLSAVPLRAQEAPAPVAETASPAAETIEAAQSILDYLLEGGPFLMIPLAALSFIAVLLIIFYSFTIRPGAVVSDKFMNAADALIRKQDYLGLIAVCNRENECIARIVYKTLDFATKNPTASFDEVREVTEAEGTRQASILNNRISYLNDISRVAPMVGLFGTVIGMIKAFESIGKSSGVQHMELAPAHCVHAITPLMIDRCGLSGKPACLARNKQNSLYFPFVGRLSFLPRPLSVKTGVNGDGGCGAKR